MVESESFSATGFSYIIFLIPVPFPSEACLSSSRWGITSQLRTKCLSLLFIEPCTIKYKSIFYWGAVSTTCKLMVPASTTYILTSKYLVPLAELNFLSRDCSTVQSPCFKGVQLQLCDKALNGECNQTFKAEEMSCAIHMRRITPFHCGKSEQSGLGTIIQITSQLKKHYQDST